MRLGLSRSRKNRGKWIIIYMFILFFAVLFYIFACRLQPAFISCASSYANNMVNRVVNESVNKVFSEEDYKSLAEVTSSSKNNIQTIETDTVRINKLKSQLNDAIQNNIRNCQAETVGVPLGSASNFYFFAGLGPKIPIRIYPISIVNTDLEEKFVSAGINQVNHKLYLNVSIEVSFAGLTFAKTETVETKVLLTETIIVGDTPEYYGNGNISAAVK